MSTSPRLVSARAGRRRRRLRPVAAPARASTSTSASRRWSRTSGWPSRPPEPRRGPRPRPALRPARRGQDQPRPRHRRRAGGRRSRPPPARSSSAPATWPPCSPPSSRARSSSSTRSTAWTPRSRRSSTRPSRTTRLDLMIGTGPGARSMKIPLKPFTLVAATTRAGLLTAPLRGRFGIVHRLDFYSEADLEFIVTRSARILGVPIDPEGAARDRAPQPRHAAHRQPPAAPRARLRPGARRAASSPPPWRATPARCWRSTSTASTRWTASCCSPSSTSSAAGPVGVSALAAAISEETDAIEDIYEPYLLQIGFLDRTPRGRVATRRAYEHFGRALPEGGPAARRSCFERGRARELRHLRLRLRAAAGAIAQEPSPERDASRLMVPARAHEGAPARTTSSATCPSCCARATCWS